MIKIIKLIIAQLLIFILPLSCWAWSNFMNSSSDSPDGLSSTSIGCIKIDQGSCHYPDANPPSFVSIGLPSTQPRHFPCPPGSSSCATTVEADKYRYVCIASTKLTFTTGKVIHDVGITGSIENYFTPGAVYSMYGCGVTPRPPSTVIMTIMNYATQTVTANLLCPPCRVDSGSGNKPLSECMKCSDPNDRKRWKEGVTPGGLSGSMKYICMTRPGWQQKGNSFTCKE